MGHLQRPDDDQESRQSPLFVLVQDSIPGQPWSLVFEAWVSVVPRAGTQQHAVAFEVGRFDFIDELNFVCLKVLPADDHVK